MKNQRLKVEYHQKPVKDSKPDWIENNIPPFGGNLVADFLLGIKPTPNSVLLTTHAAAPRLLQLCSVRGPRWFRNWAKAQLEQFQENNWVHLTEHVIEYRLGCDRGMIVLHHIIRAQLTNDVKVVLHTIDEYIELPPLCHGFSLMHAVNRLLSGTTDRSTCGTCRNFRCSESNDPTALRAGVCIAVQVPTVRPSCCPLEAHRDWCHPHSPQPQRKIPNEQE